MKKIILATVLVASSMFAEVSTITPYIGMINYDNDDAKSIKDKATIVGVHATVGTLSYLLEVDYSYINTEYKDVGISELNQDDISISYSKYFKDYMYRVGYHYISTNDDQLNDGNIFMASLGAYTWDGYDKYSYGLEGYYSIYSDGHDENFNEKSINIMQFTPYFSFYKSISLTMSNTVLVKLNYQVASDYQDDTYTSYEISDTIGYKSFFATLKYYDGEMRTGVKDNGFTVFNTLDLMKDGFDIKLGYYFTESSMVSVDYGQNNYEEYDQGNPFFMKEEGTNDVVVATFSYTY